MLRSIFKLEPVRSSVTVLTFSLILSGCLEFDGSCTSKSNDQESNSSTTSSTIECTPDSAASESDTQGLSAAEEGTPLLVGQPTSSGEIAGIVPSAPDVDTGEEERTVDTQASTTNAPDSDKEAFLGDNVLIMNRASGRALDAAENKNGGNVRIFADSGFSNQRWSIAKVGDVFSIRSMQDSTRALDTWGAGTVDGTNIALYGYYGSDSQHYYIEEADSGWYVVRPVVAADQCLDAFGLSDKGNVGTWSCHGKENQQWTFKKASAGSDRPVVEEPEVVEPEVAPYPKGILGVEGRITYNLELDGVEPKLAAYIANSMEKAVKLYNDNGVFVKHITANYHVGVPTAQGGYDGKITFGSQRNTRAALHEIAHTVGIGTHWNWGRLQKDGVWTGAAANAKFTEFQGTDSKVKVNVGHILETYGLNYDWQESSENNIRHVQLVAAMRCDLGIGPCNDFEGEDIVIVNRASGKVLDAAGNDNGSNIQIYTDYQNPNQRWAITSIGFGKHKISSMQDGNKALDTWNSGTVSGTNIALWDYSPAGGKHFVIEEVDTGWFTIKPGIADDQCVDAYGTDSGKNVGTWVCNGGENQQWGFNRSVVDAEKEEGADVAVLSDPPFSGTIFINSEIVKNSDPTSFVGITSKGTGKRTTFDRRPNQWQEAQFNLYEAEYENGDLLEIQVNSEFDSADAEVEAMFYATEIGRMPNVLRKDVRTVTIHAGTEPFGGGNWNLLIHTGQAEKYIADGILEETLIHEASHTSLDGYYANADEWKRAQLKDNMFVSSYARDNSTREDVAESYLLYLALRHKSDRISTDLENTIKDIMPARIEYFDSLGLDVYPFQ